MAEKKNYIGVNIADKYSITGKIGSGGMGQVYSAISYEDPSRTVAIKLILKDKKKDKNREQNRDTKQISEEFLRFQKEAALMSQLHHPNIICFYELGLIKNDNSSDDASAIDEGYYIVMEVADGEDLKNLLKRGIRRDLGFFLQCRSKNRICIILHSF